MWPSIPYFDSSYLNFPIFPVYIFFLSQIVTCFFRFTYETLHWTCSLSYSGIISFATNCISVLRLRPLFVCLRVHLWNRCGTDILKIFKNSCESVGAIVGVMKMSIMRKSWTEQWQRRILFMELLVMPPPTQSTANLKLNKILYFKDMNPFIIFRNFP